MLQKLDILDEALDKLDDINSVSFLPEKFNDVNNLIEAILLELKSNEQILEKNKFSEEYINVFKNLLYKIERLETKILPKANLLDSFSNSNS